MKDKIRNIFLILFACIASVHADNINIVPYPAQTNSSVGFCQLTKGFSIKTPKELKEIATILLEDIDFYTGIKGNISGKNPVITMQLDPTLASEEYNVTVSESEVLLTASNFQSMAYATTTLLHMLDSQGKLPLAKIADAPVREYRGLMLDVARQWIEYETVKQCIDLARWYKIRYIQLHLSDDQSFTFPSQKYPQVATTGRHYTKKQLKELVEYARVRGVTIIPEFDLPGHSSEMRRRMPEIFGEEGWSVIDIVNEKAIKAVKTIAKEMMDIFYTSPYFHIGADECWFGAYEKLPHVKEAVKKKGFDNVHDLYLDFIVEMYNFVKANGKQPLAWESFQGSGSRCVEIPRDLIILAWETLYQSPQSLLENGYSIINASWKPMYVVPGLRWTPEYIYNFGMTRWENHWSITPAYQNPIFLDPQNTPVRGGQMCSWEMDDPSQIQTLHTRLAAVSEAMWNDGRQTPYSQFQERFSSTDKKIMTRFFPVKEVRSGFKSACKNGLDNNRMNTFTYQGKVSMKPIKDDDIIRYTTDGSMPDKNSSILDKSLILKENTFVKYAVFNQKGDLTGYYSVKYKLSPIEAINMGEVTDPRDINIDRPKKNFTGRIQIALTNGYPDSDIYYTTDGSEPSTKSKKYTTPITIDKTTDLRAKCYTKDGKAVGEEYKCTYAYRDFVRNIATGKKFYEVIDNELVESADGQKALDGEVNIDIYWGAECSRSVVIDLEKTTTVQALNLYTFWDGNRYYQYTVDASVDGKNWSQIIDKSHNTEKSTSEGQLSFFKEREARYIRINMLKNSANPAMHIVEVRVY